MTVREKSRERCSTTNVDDSDTASVFDEVTSPVPTSPVEGGLGKVVIAAGPTTPTVVIDANTPTPVSQSRVSRKVIGLKRKAETIEGEGSKRKVSLKQVGSVTEATIKATKAQSNLMAAPPSSLTINSKSRLATLRSISSNPKESEESTEFVFSIRPLMGVPFKVTLSSDSSVFDLKDAIFSKTGLVPEMQLLCHAKLPVSFEDEEKFLDELGLLNSCSLDLSVKATAGLQVLNGNFATDEENYFVYDVFLPNDSTGAGAPPVSPSLTIEASDSEADVNLTVPIANLPLPVLESYLKGPIIQEDSQDPHRIVFQGIESLQISTSSDESVLFEAKLEIPNRPATPAPTLLPPPSNNDLSLVESQTPPLCEASKVCDRPLRCHHCGRRCRIAMQFTCKCGHTFCQDHRYHDLHGCPFDHRAFDRLHLGQVNPRVNKPQVDKL